MHCSVKPPQTLWLINVEILRAKDVKVLAKCVKDIQRIRGMWCIYGYFHWGLTLCIQQVPLHYILQQTQWDSVKKAQLMTANPSCSHLIRLWYFSNVCKLMSDWLIVKMVKKLSSVRHCLQTTDVRKYIDLIFYCGQPISFKLKIKWICLIETLQKVSHYLFWCHNSAN